MTLQYSDFDDKKTDTSNIQGNANNVIATANVSANANPNLTDIAAQSQSQSQSQKPQPGQNKFNKTIKKSPQLAELYNKIHNNATEENETENKMASFIPMEPSTLSKNEPITEPSEPWSNDIESKINNYNETYYNSGSQLYSPNTQMSPNDQLLNKLNYVIQLLEDQKDERTNYVSEELILYTFLGIFIIFIIDSFAKATKYIR
jgi:hypothetical protein